ncbi:nucleotidyltransferase domain-containing protein [Rickettsiales bacterium]|nr:nucleotidyltransferase domain-containing protein [Rickettsiales bacterium]
MNSGLSATITNDIRSVFSRYEQVDSAILYGSRATGNYRPGSDIDLTLIGDDLDFNLLTRIINDLDDLLTAYKFDISIFKDINNEKLIEHINRFGIKFYNKQGNEND